MSELIKRLKVERIQVSSAVLNYSNFDYWVNWDDIVDIVEDYDQLQLNPSQQIVLDYLKDKCNLYSFIAYKPFEAIIRLSMLDPEKNELRVTNTIDELTYLQQSQVLEIFSRWAQEQEEE
ncbi:hypothetical protein [Enterococcus hermanniensis]|nr:hypothetical protein [Enterococcus hermanniensis]